MRKVYADNAKAYIEAGFVPLPWKVFDGKKRPVGKGYLEPEPPIRDWIHLFPTAEIGIVSRGWIGIDVDASEHGGKSGDQTILELEGYLGKLPPAPSSTARGQDSKSRIYFYSIPEDDRRYRDVGRDVEAIRPGHRFAAVAPSRHPNGNEYVWYTADNVPMDGIPSRYDFPPLPDKWVKHLTAQPRRAGGYAGSVQDWLDALPDGDIDSFVSMKLTALEAEFGHTDLLRTLMWLVHLGAAGRPGVRAAIEVVREKWLRGLWDDDAHREEFESALDWAVSRAGAPPPEEEKVDVDERWEAAQKPPEVFIDRAALAETLKVFCKRFDPDWETLRENDEQVAEKFRQCLDLLSSVQTTEDTVVWLEATKKAMTRAIGAKK